MRLTITVLDRPPVRTSNPDGRRKAPNVTVFTLLAARVGQSIGDAAKGTRRAGTRGLPNPPTAALSERGPDGH